MRTTTPIVPLESAYSFQEGPGLRKWQFKSEGVKVLNVGNITKDGRLDLSKTDRFISEEEVKTRYQHFLVDDGDLVVASSGISFDEDGLLRTRGVFVGKEDLPLCMNTSTIRFKPKKDISDLCYLRHWIDGPEFRTQISRLVTGSAQQNFGPSHLRSIQITLPPLKEQRRIAAILDKADALRRKGKRALDLLDSLTQSIFLEMFGDLVEGCDYPRGTVSDWVADFDTGKNLAPDPDARQINGYRVLKVSAVTTGIFLPDESKPLPVGYEPPRSHIVKKGDLLFSRANTADLIGATAYVESTHENLALPDKIWRFVWRQTNIPNSRFIHALFSTPSFRRELSKRATGTSGSMKNISKPKVLGIEVALPNRRQQDEFAIRHRSIQRSVSATVLQAATLENQFSSLQSRAFSGQL